MVGDHGGVGVTASRQDWQGATDDEVNTAINNCDLSLELSDRRKEKYVGVHIKAVKATLLWIMDAVKNPHPLD